MLTKVTVDGEEVDYINFVLRLFAKKNTEHDGTLHAAVGVAGECGELLDLLKKKWVYGKTIDRSDLVEELGDINFYFRALVEVLYGDRSEVPPVDVRKPSARQVDAIVFVSDLFILSGLVLEDAVSIYRREEDPATAKDAAENIGRRLDSFVTSLAIVHAALDIAPAEALAANVRKLRARYPDGYTDQAAIARADKAGGDLQDLAGNLANVNFYFRKGK